MVQSYKHTPDAGEEFDEDHLRFDTAVVHCYQRAFRVKPYDHVLVVTDFLGDEIEAEVQCAVIGHDLGDYFGAVAHDVAEAS